MRYTPWLLPAGAPSRVRAGLISGQKPSIETQAIRWRRKTRSTEMPYADNKGTKVFYDTYGQGTPIVFLHPWTTNGYIWYYQVFPFARTNQVIVVDHRGHGRSDKPKSGYSIQEHASDVAAVLDAAKVDKAVLVGNSIGGMIAMQFTLDHPDRVIGNLILSS